MLNDFLKIRYNEYSSRNHHERFCDMLYMLNGFRIFLVLPTYALALYVNIFWITSTILLLSTLIIAYVLSRYKDNKNLVNLISVYGVTVDFALAVTLMQFIDSKSFEYGVNFFLVAIIIEAAYLWKILGSVIVSIIASITTCVWLLARNDFQFGTRTGIAIGLRTVVFIFIALGIGSLLQVFQEATDDLAQHYETQEETIEKLLEVAELKDDFISTASHELRTPITSLMGYLNVVDDPRIDAETRAEIQVGIGRQIYRLHDLVEDLLAVGLIDSDRSGSIGESTNLNSYISELVDDVEVINSRKVNIIFLNSSKEAENINIDKNFLRRVLINLIQNAFKYSNKDTEVKLTINMIENRLYFEIQDFGYGIEGEELENIFNKFHRAKRNRNISGSGLGLYIVKGLVESMGGEITVESKVDVGTTMKFYIKT